MKLIDIMQDYLDEVSLTSFRSSDGDSILVCIHGGDYLAKARIDADENAKYIAVRVDGGIFVPVARRTAAGAFIMLANYGLRIGGFQLSSADGQVFFQTSLFAPTSVPLSFMEPLLSAAINTYSRYHAGLFAVAYHDSEPEALIAAIENWPSRAVTPEEVNAVFGQLVAAQETPFEPNRGPDLD